VHSRLVHLPLVVYCLFRYVRCRLACSPPSGQVLTPRLLDNRFKKPMDVAADYLRDHRLMALFNDALGWDRASGT
jgi:hypothetical protein